MMASKNMCDIFITIVDLNPHLTVGATHGSAAGVEGDAIPWSVPRVQFLMQLLALSCRGLNIDLMPSRGLYSLHPLVSVGQ